MTGRASREKSMAPRKDVRIGDVLAIPLGDASVAAGVVLHVSKRIRDGIIVGYVDRLFPSIEAIDVGTLDGSFTHGPQYTSAQMVREGDWPVVGQRPDLANPDRVPVLRIATTLYRGDEVV